MNVTPAVRKDSLATMFNSISTSFKGLGIKLHLLDDFVDTQLPIKLNNLPFQFAHVHISTPDPGPTVLNIEHYSDMNALFSNAPNALGGGGQDNDGNDILSTAQRFFKDISSRQMRLVLTFVIPPSWLLADDSKMLTGNVSLKGYANYILSGVLWVRSFGFAADLVEIFHQPDNESDGYGWISPTDYVIFLGHLRTISIDRGITLPYVKFLAPGLSSVLPLDTVTDVYSGALISARNSFDIWSIHAYEHDDNLNTANAGTFSSRKLLSDRLERNVAQMNSVNNTYDKISSEFGTKATKFPRIITFGMQDNLGDYVDTSSPNDIAVVANSNEYAVRVLENFCGILRCGFFAAIYGGGLTPYRKTIVADNETEDDVIVSIEENSLYSDNGTLRPIGKIMSFLLQELPIPGDIYISEELNPVNDHTVKTLVMSSTADKFFFILCRPKSPDPLDGKLRLIINNPLWSTSYIAEDLLVRSFPDASRNVTMTTELDDGTTETTVEKTSGVDLSGIAIKTTFSQGSCKFDLKNLPYGSCILFFSGKIALKPPVPLPNPSPLPIPPPGGGTGVPVIMQTIIQMSVYYGEPSSTNYAQGTVFYDSKAKKLKTFINGAWVATTPLQYV